MTKLGPDLMALVGSRICHDLISPLGAIGNGMELLEMSGVANGPEMDLITQSVENANARIRFFRIAFGAASDAQRLGRSELGAVLDGIYNGERISVQHDLASDMNRLDAKLALLVVLCLEKTLPRGGTIHLDVAGKDWTLRCAGPNLQIDDRLWRPLTSTSPPENVVAAEVQFALLPEAAARAGRALAVTLGADEISVAF